jgi:hypothetical protein
MWAVLLDDIASQNPNKGTSDQTLSDLLQICNQVAFCPPQAELADKGKTPMRPEFVQATTNTEHLNAHAWFANPVAVRRRLPFIIEIKPKREFARDDAPDMLDGSKCPMPDPGTYPDCGTSKFQVSLSKLSTTMVARMSMFEFCTISQMCTTTSLGSLMLLYNIVRFRNVLHQMMST